MNNSQIQDFTYICTLSPISYKEIDVFSTSFLKSGLLNKLFLHVAMELFENTIL